MKLDIKNAVLILFSIPLFFGCQNNAGNAAAHDGAADAESAAATPSGDGSFSAVIDGQTVTGKGSDQLQLQNNAFRYPAQDKKEKYILFDLASTKNGADFYSFRFYVPDKEGTFAVADAEKNGIRCSVRLDFNLKSTDNFAIYYGDQVTVNIQKLSSTRISGTFSGEFKLSSETRSKPYKASVNLTDGKFDIPFSTGNLRPE